MEKKNKSCHEDQKNIPQPTNLPSAQLNRE